MPVASLIASSATGTAARETGGVLTFAQVVAAQQGDTHCAAGSSPAVVAQQGAAHLPPPPSNSDTADRRRVRGRGAAAIEHVADTPAVPAPTPAPGQQAPGLPTGSQKQHGSSGNYGNHHYHLNFQIEDNHHHAQPLNPGAVEFITGNQPEYFPTHQTGNNFPGKDFVRSDSANRFSGFDTSERSDASGGPDENQPAENYQYYPDYYDTESVPGIHGFSSPIPEGIPVGLATCLPATMHVFSHDAIAGKTMV